MVQIATGPNEGVLPRRIAFFFIVDFLFTYDFITGDSDELAAAVQEGRKESQQMGGLNLNNLVAAGANDYVGVKIVLSLSKLQESHTEFSDLLRQIFRR